MLNQTQPVPPDRLSLAPGGPTHANVESEPTEGLFARLISGNYFYFLSAALMLWGCYLKMHATSVTATPAIFVRTLKTLLILQGYEVLVIVTALAIVRRLKMLDDAFSLLLVELLLLLDPTFFSNSFFTMLKSESVMLNTWGVTVNIVCLYLVSFKLFILQRGLSLRFSRGAWMSFSFAALLAYLAEAPLCLKSPLPWLGWYTYQQSYFYLLTWGPLVFALLAPPLDSMLASEPAAAEIPPRRRTALWMTMIVLPLAIIIAHLAESARVHEINLFAFQFAPLVLAAGVLLVRQARAEREFMGLFLIVCDFCAVLTLLLASGLLESPAAKGTIPHVGYAIETLPSFAVGRLPLILCGTGVAGLYGLFYARFRYRPALYRLELLVLAGFVAGLAQVPLVRVAALALSHGLHAAGQWSASAAGHAGHWLRHGLAFGLLHFLEIFQALIVLALTFDHLRRHPRLPREARAIIATMAVVCGLIRYENSPAAWSGAVCFTEWALLMLGAWRVRKGDYLAIAAIQTAVFILISLNYENWFSRGVIHTLHALGDGTGAFFTSVELWVLQHPHLVLAVVWLGLLGLAARWPHSMTWFGAGLLTIWIIAGWLPGRRSDWLPEMIQGVFVLGMVIDHRFNRGPNRFGRYFTAILIVTVALLRFSYLGTSWAGVVAGGEAMALLGAAFLVQHPGYLFIGLAELVAIGWIGWASGKFEVSPAIGTIGGALALFAIGVAVTFNKARLLRWVARLEPPLVKAVVAEGPATDPSPVPAAPGFWEEELQAVRGELQASGVLSPAAPAEAPLPPAPAASDGFGEAMTGAEGMASPPSLPPAADAGDQEILHRMATVQILFENDPPMAITRFLELPPELRMELEDKQADPHTAEKAVFLVKGELTGAAWRVIPAWICYSADPRD